VGNKELLTATDSSSSSNIKKFGQPQPQIPLIATRGRPSRASKKRKGVEKRKNREGNEEKDKDLLFLSPYFCGTFYNFHEKRRFATGEKKIYSIGVN